MMHDVAVVGAGPAGTAAALRVLRERPGSRVVLLDAATFPRDKCCGDGIAAEVFDLLAALGVPDVADLAPPVPRLRLSTPNGWRVDRACQRPSRVIPRAVFDAVLVNAAVARGVELHHHRVRTLEVAPDRAKQVAQQKVLPVVSQVASEVSDNLREPAQQAMDSVKSTAQDAGQTVGDKGRPAAQDVQGRAQDAAGTVRRRLRRRCAPPPRIGHAGDARSPRATTGCRGDGPWGARAARVGSASPSVPHGGTAGAAVRGRTDRGTPARPEQACDGVVADGLDLDDRALGGRQ
jgi:FAD binding domain